MKKNLRLQGWAIWAEAKDLVLCVSYFVKNLPRNFVSSKSCKPEWRLHSMFL